MNNFNVGDNVWYITQRRDLFMINKTPVKRIREIEGRRIVSCTALQFYEDDAIDIYKNKKDAIVASIKHLEEMKDE